jgi:hypothetical protein
MAVDQSTGLFCLERPTSPELDWIPSSQLNWSPYLVLNQIIYLVLKWGLETGSEQEYKDWF